MPIDTSYMKKVGVQISASSPSSRNVQATVNRLVYAIGEEHLIRLQAEMMRDDALHRFALGIDRHPFSCELLQLREDARARRESVLVEVKTQRSAAGERRMVLRHREHGARGCGTTAVAFIEFIHERRRLIHYSLLTIHCTAIAHPHAHAFGVGLQSFGFGERDGVRANLAKRIASVLLHGNDLHKVETR